jgi:formylglycine-generating enzyme required for sulfatase activity
MSYQNTGFGFLLVAWVGFTALPAQVPRAIQVKPGSAQPTAPEARVALVIGNAAYADSPLRNPVNDARDMATALRAVGFQVDLLLDADRPRMFKAVRDFGQRINGGGVGLFYYAGHGMAVKGNNYLVPVATDIAGEDEVEVQALSVQSVLNKMEAAKNRLNILILDACRNNPFGHAFRSGGRGLAQMDAPAGSFIAYATAPGSLASDGQSSHGLYTQHLLQAMKLPGLTVEQVFKRVRVEVKLASKDQQVPWDSSSLTGDFYFVGDGAEPAHPLPAAVPGPAIAAPAAKTAAALPGPFQNRLGMVFAPIPAGSYMMGEDSHLVDTSLKQAHKIQLSRPFAMQTTHVTVRQWRAFIEATGYTTEAESTGKARTWNGKIAADVSGLSWKNPGFKLADDQPAVCLTWNDAQAFLGWLKREDPGKGYRLPTEAEWEYACRAGRSSLPYLELDRLAWYWDNSMLKAHPVATKTANAWGLYDMLGNAWQWCQDRYGKDYYAESPAVDPKGPASGSHRVRRGGSFITALEHLGFANRGSGLPNDCTNQVGFRLVADLP